MIGVIILVLAVVLAVGFGLYRRVTDGSFGQRRGAAPRPLATTWDSVAAATGEGAPGERATLVQFSSAFCSPCRATRVVLEDVAGAVPGVRHLEVDAEHHLELVRELGVTRTPTTLILDATGAEVSRAAGAPRKEQVLAAVERAIDA